MEAERRKCETCNITVLAAEYDDHLKEKRHRLREQMQMKSNTNGVFLAQLPKHITKDVLMNVLRMYGPVRSCNLNIEKKTAIAEFETSEGVEKFLKEPVRIANNFIHAARSRESPPATFVEPETIVDTKIVRAALESAEANGITDVDKQIELVIDKVRLQDPCWGIKMLRLQKDLEECISKIMPGCCAIPFGSVVTGLSLKGSDADIVITSVYYGQRMNEIPPKKLVKEVRRLMNRHQQKFVNIVGIPMAKTPIVKLVHVPTKISCDLSFHYTYSRKKSDYLRYVLGLDPRIRQIIIFLKYWGKCKKLINTTRFSSHAITLMVIFYLQKLDLPLIPPFHVITENNIPALQKKIKNTESLSNLIKGFFSFFAEMEAGGPVLCLWVGRFVHRGALTVNPIKPIPVQLIQYKVAVEEGAVPLELDSPLVVQDPFEWEKNVTGRITEKSLCIFRDCCAQALQDLRKGAVAQMFCDALDSDLNLTVRAVQYLMDKYLIPESMKDDVKLSRGQLFERWLKVVLALIRHFLSKFARLEVTEEDEPRKKSAKTSEQSKASGDNDDESDSRFPRHLILSCSGHAIAESWQKRKKVAAVLQLNSLPVSFMEREARISEHLAQSGPTEEPVQFFLRFEVDDIKEQVRFSFSNCTSEPVPYQSVSGHLCNLIPLWLKNAFESGASLNCLTGSYVPPPEDISNKASPGDCETTDTLTTEVQKKDANINDGNAQASVGEETIKKQVENSSAIEVSTEFKKKENENKQVKSDFLDGSTVVDITDQTSSLEAELPA